MFSTIIDVAIGMIFIYLLLSLMCSAANEIIELMLKKRAIDLERGIREMLAPGSKSVKSEAKNGEPGTNDKKSDTKDIVQELYNHSLIRNLFDRNYETSRIASWTRYVWRTRLPSYIPARNFALALMDLVGTPTAAAAAAPTGPPPSGSSPVSPTPPASTGAASSVTPPASGATGATPPPADFEITLTQPPPAPPAPNETDNPLKRLRQGVASSPLLDPVPEVRQGLIALIDAAGNDVAKARENIETWFNNTMDRVSSWYKRRTQVAILILGLLLAVALNADSVAIAKRLSTDESLRESLVAASVEYAKAHASPTATPTPTPEPQESKSETSGTAPTKPDAERSRSAAASGSSSKGTTETTSQSIPQECIKDPNSKDCKDKARAEACKKPDSPQCKFLSNLNTLEGLGLPIGWSSEKPSEWGLLVFLAHLFGWLLTALAISLGAPFWFDLLNKFIVVRSAVKPHEKSPEEESKG